MIEQDETFERPAPGNTKQRPFGNAGWYGTNQNGITLLFKNGDCSAQAEAFAASAGDTYGEALEWVVDNLTAKDAGGVFLASPNPAPSEAAA